MRGRLGRRSIAKLLSGRGYEATADPVALRRLGLEHPDRVNYTASPWWILRVLLRQSEVRPSDVFVDFGCGKGRVVLDAATRYRFKRVLGVELAPELCDIARHLVAQEQSRLRCREVTIVTADATEYQVPDDTTHVYLYNPFNGDSFKRFCANLVASLDRVPRYLRVIYVLPLEHETLAATGRFKLVRRVRFPPPRRFVGAAIYETV